jgi:xylulokinase
MARPAPAAKYVLAIDHGTSGVKTALVTTTGRVLGHVFEKTPIFFLPDGGAEQDPHDWWNALRKAVKALLRQKLAPVEDIVAIGVSSTFSSTVAVDADGEPLMNSLTWMDSRGAPHVRRLMHGFPTVAGYAVRNLLRWIPKTAGGPTLSGKDDIAHVLFIQHERPEVYRRTRAFLPSKDYLNARLTGEIASSYDAMTLFWVVNTRDIRRPHYDDELIRGLGLDRDKLPPLKPSTAILGRIKADVADELGLPRHVQVVVGSPDHQSACIGSGAVRDYEGHVYIGTSSWVQCVAPFKKTDVRHSIATLPTAIPGRYQTVNEQDLAGGCLGFVLDNIFLARELRPNGALPDNPYPLLDELAARAPAGSRKLIFAPWLNGERTPVDDLTIRGGFFNVAKTHELADFVRAVFEGVAYNTRWSLQFVERFVNRRLEPLNLIGGGATSPVWCQIFADVIDRRLRVVKAPMQANARGAAFIAAVGLGYLTFDDIPRLIEYEQTYEPTPAHRRTYDELFAAFVRFYQATKDICRDLNRG